MADIEVWTVVFVQNVTVAQQENVQTSQRATQLGMTRAAMWRTQKEVARWEKVEKAKGDKRGNGPWNGKDNYYNTTTTFASRWTTTIGKHNGVNCIRCPICQCLG